MGCIYAGLFFTTTGFTSIMSAISYAVDSKHLTQFVSGRSGKLMSIIGLCTVAGTLACSIYYTVDKLYSIKMPYYYLPFCTTCNKTK